MAPLLCPPPQGYVAAQWRWQRRGRWGCRQVRMAPTTASQARPMAAADSGEPSEARMPLPPSPSPPPPPPPATPHPIASARKRRATHTDAYLESVYTPAQRPKGREGGIIVARQKKIRIKSFKWLQRVLMNAMFDFTESSHSYAEKLLTTFSIRLHFCRSARPPKCARREMRGQSRRWHVGALRPPFDCLQNHFVAGSQHDPSQNAAGLCLFATFFMLPPLHT